MKKIRKHKQKRTFAEYGFKLNEFNITEDNIGKVEYAQWLHPSEKDKVISDENICFYKIFVRKGSLAIDIGAHTGDTTVPLALATGKEGLVIALEPNRYVFEILKKNSELNKEHTNIIPLCMAATMEDGKYIFNYSDASFCNGGYLSQINFKKHKHNYTLEVQGVNFNNYLLQNFTSELPRLGLIKIDAEGYDQQILKSLSNIITTYKPNLIVECYKRLNSDERNQLYDQINR